MRVRLGVGLVLAGFLALCWATSSPVSAEEPKKLDDTKVPTFKTDIAPLLNSSCTGCHNANKKKAGVDVSSYDGIMKIVKANEADKSKLVKSVSGTGAKLMPPKKGLSDKQIDVIKAWINAGAKND
jgi:hypothetical protein